MFVFFSIEKNQSIYLDISTLGHFDEMFLLFQRLLFLVVGHAEDPEARLFGLVPLGEHHEPGVKNRQLLAPQQLCSHDIAALITQNLQHTQIFK